MNLIQKLYLKRINFLLDIGYKNGLIKPFDDDLYRELNQTIFYAIPVDLDIKYLKPDTRPGKCYDRSLKMFFAMDYSKLVRGSLEYFRVFGDKEQENHGWVERDGYVYDPTWLCKFDKDYYYKIFKVKDVNKCSHIEYCQISQENLDLYINTKKITRERLRVDNHLRYNLLTTIPILLGLNQENNEYKAELNKYIEEVNYDYKQISKTLNEELNSRIHKK